MNIQRRSLLKLSAAASATPLLAGVSGAYFEDCNPVQVSGDHHMFDAVMAKRLWLLAEDITVGYV